MTTTGSVTASVGLAMASGNTLKMRLTVAMVQTTMTPTHSCGVEPDSKLSFVTQIATMTKKK